MRWNKRVAVVGAVLIVGVWVIVATLRFAGGLDRYCGVYAADNRKEVLYRLGSPPHVLGPPQTLPQFGTGSDGFWQMFYTPGSTDPKDEMPSGKTISDFPGWVYSPAGDVTITVSFDKADKVESIECMTGHPGGCAPLAGVAFGDTEEQVIHHLGKWHSEYMLDGVSKSIRYDDLGVEFVLTKEHVYMMKLYGKRPPFYASILDYLLTIPRRLVPG